MMFSEAYSYYNTYNGTKRSHDISQEEVSTKRRRLIDHLGSLNLGSTGSTETTTRDPSPSMFPPQSFPSSCGEEKKYNEIFGHFDNVQLNRKWNSYEHPNKVIINNIDQFLKENPERLDYIGGKIKFEELERNYLLRGDLLIDRGVLKRAWNKVVCEYKNGDSSNGLFGSILNNKKSSSDLNIDELVRKLVWEEYVLKYVSLIKYYNPMDVVWSHFFRWQDERLRGSRQIEELNDEDEDDDEDEDMMDTDDELIDPTVSSKSSNQQIHFGNGMSNYGSYYGEEHPWDKFDANDDDIMMDD